MKQYDITGMSCTACSARVEKAVSGVDGVTSCTVNLLTNSMGVEGTASESDIIKAVENAGYGASAKGTKGAVRSSDELKDRETPLMKKRLLWSLGFLAVLMYISMGHGMFGLPLPSAMSKNHLMTAVCEMLLAVAVMVINQKFFISGVKSLLHRSPNMDTLVALGSGASFVYSTFVLFAMTDSVTKGDMERTHRYMHDFYFESSAMILTLITVGKMLEARSKGKTADALKGLMNLAPKTAVLCDSDGNEKTVPIEQVKKGDTFIVRAGGNIPVDAVITEGECSVDESALTGESIPSDKLAGDSVSSATTVRSGFIKCRAERVGEDTTLSQIIQMVSDASATKAPIAKTADKVSGVFVPAVICISAVTFIIWLILGKPVSFSVARAVSVLVISCPCALGLATPVAIMVGNGVGAKNGILFKNAVSLEETGKADIVVLDKTGTVTEGKPQTTDVIPVSDREKLVTLAYSLEKKSEHPLAGAVTRYAEEKGADFRDVLDFRTVAGNGLSGTVGGKAVYGGNYSFISRYCKVSDEIRVLSEKLSEQGKTPLFFAEDGELLGLFAVADVIKSDSPQAVKELKEMGIHVVMLTGDNQRTADAVGRQAGVNDVIAGVLPDGKESEVKRLKKKGKVIMVGDGINDAPALVSADVGIAIGAGSDIAVDSADVVLMKSRLSDVTASIRLSRAVLKNIHQNLFWAFIYNVIGIPLATGLYTGILHWELNPMIASGAMSLSSFCVVTNALRLNLVKVHDPSKDRRKRVNGTSEGESGELTEITVKVKGMMCGHCEARVKEALESIDGVDEAVVSHERGTAVVRCMRVPDKGTVKKAVKSAGYGFLGMD